MNEDLGVQVLQDVLRSFRQVKSLAERAIEQVAERQLVATLDAESNSMAVLMKHLGGNMRSRWSDFLTSDGEKPDRRRDTEFEQGPETTKASVTAIWEDGWRSAFDGIAALHPDDLQRRVRIRGEIHTVVQALHRQLTHTAYHVGQIVLLAKHLRSDEWRSLTIPRGKSQEFNDAMQRNAAAHGERPDSRIIPGPDS